MLSLQENTSLIPALCKTATTSCRSCIGSLLLTIFWVFGFRYEHLPGSRASIGFSLEIGSSTSLLHVSQRGLLDCSAQQVPMSTRSMSKVGASSGRFGSCYFGLNWHASSGQFCTCYVGLDWRVGSGLFFAWGVRLFFAAAAACASTALKRATNRALTV